MRQCPVCLLRYDSAIDTCPRDGTRLVSLNPLIGTTLDDKFRIDAQIGRGAMGTVYRATQLNLERPVAIKIIRSDILSNPVAIERFKREALAIARLKHPRIVSIYDYGVSSQVGAYIVMEHLEGHSLNVEVKTRERIPIENAIRWMRQVCSAVSVAHTAGVIHRDLKPGNIFLETTQEGPFVKVLDFGLAKLQRNSDDGVMALTKSGTLVGSPPYMSPEQCEDLPLDAQSDIYSLGCVFYEMVAGRPPFLGGSPIDTLVKHMNEEPRRPSEFAEGIPPAIDEVLLKALSKHKMDRYESATEFGQVLAAIDVSVDPDR
ncbi:MAG TPA: serine/threonine-protein kinase [Blastocatellia bacterium]|nr:serine/threonine-protein kinase [Blastocatellia bacterium]